MIIFPYTYIPFGWWNKPVFVVHDCRTYYTNFNPPLKNIYIKLLLNFSIRVAYKIVAISNFTQLQLLKIFPGATDKVTRIYNLTTDSGYSSEIHPVKKNQFCYIGHIEGRKNIQMLVAVANEFKESKFILGGKIKTAFKKEFFDLIKGTQNIDYRGFVTDNEKNDILAGSKWFINLSNYEGFGYTPLEAYNYGCRLILSDIPAHKEIVGQNNALFLNLFDSNAINFKNIRAYMLQQNSQPEIDLCRFSKEAFVSSWNGVLQL